MRVPSHSRTSPCNVTVGFYFEFDGQGLITATASDATGPLGCHPVSALR